MGTGIYTKVSGTWKEADDYFVNVNGTWRTGSEIHANVSGTWKESDAGVPFVDTGNDRHIGPWSSSWTAPAGITQVRVTLVGGVSVDNWTTTPFSGGLRFHYTGTPGTITSASAYAAFSAWESAHFSTINSSSGQRYLSTSTRQGLVTSYTVNTGETVNVYFDGPLKYNASNYPPSVGISGTLITNPSSATVDFGNWNANNKTIIHSVYVTGLNYLEPARAGITGATANMFGLSATGALTGNTPQTTGPSIVQVTPGTTYSSNLGFVQTGYAYPFNQYVMGSVHIEW